MVLASPIEADFVRALLDAEAPLPGQLRQEASGRAARRFAIHRNTVLGGLVKALEQRYPAAKAILGEAFFRAMAAAFARLNPPRSPLMHLYGEGFDEFAEHFPPVASLPYLPDVLRLEDARIRAWHAAEAEPFSLAALLAALEREETPDLALHPSARLIASDYPVVTLWTMQVGREPLRPITEWQREEALVCRLGDDVLVQRLSPGSVAFARAFTRGEPLEAAAEAALERDPGFAPQAVLAELIAAEALIVRRP